MNKVIKRLLTFFIGTPLVLAIVFCDYLNHLPLQIVLGIFAVLGANEFYTMLSKKGYVLFTREIVLIGTALLPFSCYIFILSGLSLDITPWLYIAIIVLFMGFECFTAKTFENSVQKIAYSGLTLFYTGFLITFISRMTLLPDSKFVISLFLIFVFMCDSFAWFFGILFGKSTRGFVAASPNKSLVGFIGGIAGSIGCGFLFKYLFPDVFTLSNVRLLILGLITSISAIIGDLIESVFKRSCEVKDSGNLIPGRGGILDSIDSVVIAAPIFYIGYNFLF
ncbi:phosphatidate cytidylyltransferase [Treponema bryantii]|uniref:Phosphatidate cytidylyltransferase n=1 Tax=Treponema bryantii TaxID=163 RepID=A0A1I3IXL0_9SPIR|nr:phosphatidate cytidylyltransferase [Treponema bryantii]SFI52679.1 phosphatidate cytidylyltransferase [Treponema bryantii]